MSWDVLFLNAAQPPPRVSEMPENWEGDSLGTPEEVRERISAVLPETDWADPAWGVLDSDTFSYEFSVGSESPCTGFMVHVRGGGDAVAPLLDLGRKWDWYLLDMSHGEWVHHLDDPDSGWVMFQEYRDKVLGDA